MEQLIESFGIDVKLIIAQIVNFAILVAALSYFLYKPMLKFLNDREEKIAQGVTDAEAAAQARADADLEKSSILGQAHGEAGEIVDRAKTHATEKEADIVAAAEAKAERTLAEAYQKGEAMQKSMQAETEAEITKLAVLAAEKVLREKAAS